MMWFVTGLLTFAIILLWIRYRRKRFSMFRDIGIPGPRPNFFFGNLLEMANKSPLDCHKEWIEKYGRVVGFYFGACPFLLVADPEILKKIQIAEFRNFPNRPRVFTNLEKPKKGDGFSCALTSLRDKRWKDVRSILTPSFSSSKMRMMTPIMSDAVDDLMANIECCSKTDRSFDIYDLFQRLSMDIIGKAAFGVDSGCQKDPSHPFLRSARMFFARTMASIMTILPFSFPEFAVFWQLVSQSALAVSNKGINPIQNFIDTVSSVVKARRNNESERRQDFLQMMIDARMTEAELNKITEDDLTAASDNNSSRQSVNSANGMNTSEKTWRFMDDDEILSNAIIFFLAGYETTSTTLSFIAHFLVHYQDVQDKVRAEINAVIEKEGKLDYSDVQQLHYLDQVINETLRMYPPIYQFVSRETSEDVRLEHYTIKKGTGIIVAIHYLQHDEKFWSQPETFDPERFSPENKGKIRPLTFQPFGAGPRNCIGMRFALMEIKLALSRILHRYRLVPCKETDGDPVHLKVSPIVLCPEKGVILKAVKI